jgi:neutral trehalase
MLFPTKHPETNIFKDIVNPVCSQVKNGMQWDYPNVWAPNNWILHEVSSEEERFKFAQQWVSTTYCSWKNTGLIYEKYRNDKLGERGEGG